MSIDKLQEKIRRLKNPLAIDFDVLPEHIPFDVLEAAGNVCVAYKVFCKNLLSGLKDTVPAVRFHFSTFALMGPEGLEVMESLLSYAREQGYYVLLDGIEALSLQNATRAAQLLLLSDRWHFDGLILSAYIGSDALRPYTEKLKETGKDLFVVARTSNKSAVEVQDLLFGTRLVHMAMADIVNRFAESSVGKSGYSNVALMAAASSADCLRNLRGRFKHVFLLLDGCDYPNANAKNCSLAFDKLGHGAMAIAGLSVIAAWQLENEPAEYVSLAVQSAERLKKNLNRYVTIL